MKTRQSRVITLLCIFTLFVWVGLVFPTTSWAAQLLDDGELRVLGANSTLQIKTILRNGAHSYGSAIAWKKTRRHLIIATAYHVLKGAKAFEILPPHHASYNQKTKVFKHEPKEKRDNFWPVPSSQLEVYAEPAYDLVLIRLNLTDNNVIKTRPWLSKVEPVRRKCTSESQSGRAFGFPGFYKGRFSLYDPEVTLGKADLLGSDLSIKYLKNSAKMRILHLTLDPTAKGMSGGPVLDKTGCFRGMVIGRLPDILGIAVNYEDINFTYTNAVFAKKFNRFDDRKNPFTEETVFSPLAEEQLSGDDETTVNDVSWLNAKDWGYFFDDFSVFRRQLHDIRINLEHYRFKNETDTPLKLRKIGYERAEVRLTVNGEEVEVPQQEVDLSPYLCLGRNQILIHQTLRKNRHQVFLNDIFRSNQLNLALELGDRRIYRINRELPAILSDSYRLILYLFVDKLPASNHNVCRPPKGTKNGQFAIRLPSLQKKLFSTPVSLPVSFPKPNATFSYNFDGCLQVGTEEAIQKANPAIGNSNNDHSRCQSVCVNKEFGYVDFGLFGTLKINEAYLAFDAYKAQLVDGTTIDEQEPTCLQNGNSLDSRGKFSLPLHYGTRLELLNNKNEKSGWMFRGTNADFFEKRTLIHLGCSPRFFSAETDFFVDLTRYLPDMLMLWINQRLSAKQELQTFDESYFKELLSWSTEETSEKAKLLKSSTVDLDSRGGENDWLLIDVQLGEVQTNPAGAPQTFAPVLESEFASKYPEADVFVELDQIQTHTVALGDLVPQLSNLELQGSLNLNNLQAALTLPDNLAAIGATTDYCDGNESPDKFHFGTFYEKLLVEFFKNPDIEMAFTFDSNLEDGSLFKNKQGMKVQGGYLKGKGTASLKLVKKKTGLTFEDVEMRVEALTLDKSDKFKLENATLSLSSLELFGSDTKLLTGKGIGSIKTGLVELEGLRIAVPEGGLPFTIDFDAQRQEFLKLNLQSDMPLFLNLPQGEFKLNLQPIELAISETGTTIKADTKPTTVRGSQPKLKAVRALPEPKRSFLPLSVRIPTATVRAMANRALPTEFRQDGINLNCSFGHCRMNLVVRRRGDISLDVSGQQLYARVPLSVDVRVDWWEEINLLFDKVRISHHEDADADIDVHINSPLGLNRNWQIESRTQLNSQVNRANLGNLGKIIRLLNKLGAKIDIHQEIQKLLQPQLNNLAVEIDRKLAETEVKREVTRVWTDLQQPRKLLDNPPSWLSTELDQVYFGGLQGNGGEIKLDLAVGGKLYGQVGSGHPVRHNKPLPPLTLQAPPSKNFDINLYLTVNIEEIKQQLAARLNNRRFEITKGLSANLELQNAYGNGNQLVTEVGFTVLQQQRPLVKGQLSLSGQPIWNDHHKQLEIRQFDIVLGDTVDNNNAVLLKQLAAVANLKDSFVFPLQDKVEQAKNALEAQINRLIFEDREMGKFYLQGGVTTLGIQEVLVQKEQILILLRTTGWMKIRTTD